MTNPAITPDELLRHAGFIRSLAASLVSQDHDADDIAQEAMLRALRQAPAETSAQRPWLGRVLTNLVRRRHRDRLRADRRESQAARAEAISSTIDIAARNEELLVVAQRVCGLPEPYRSMVHLRYYEGLTPRRIAAQLAIPEATVKTRLRRGLELIRSSLDAAHDGDRERWRQALAPCVAIPLIRSSTAIYVMLIFCALPLASAVLFLSANWNADVDPVVDALAPGNELSVGERVAALVSTDGASRTVSRRVELAAGSQELAHDDGKADGKRSSAGAGHAVRFERPGDSFVVTKIRVHGSRYGGRFDPYLAVARVRLLDAELGTIVETFVAFSEWQPGKPRWVDVDVQATAMPEVFFAQVEFFPSRTRGIYLSIDADNQGHSFATSARGGSQALNEGEWMIRAVGTVSPPKVERPDDARSQVLVVGKGPATGHKSTAGSGHAVRFKRPSSKPFLTHVEIHGQRYGGNYEPERTFFHVFVCDKRMKVLARSAHPYSLFGVSDADWQRVAITPVKVPSTFYVLVHFDPTATRGVDMDMWKEGTSASLQATPNGRGKKTAKGQGWMVRATVAASKGKVAVQPSTVEPTKKDKEPLDALELATLYSELDAAEAREDLVAANALLAAARAQAPGEVAAYGQFCASDHFVLRHAGVPGDYVKALLTLMETAHQALVQRFGFERVSAVAGKRIHLHVLLEKGATSRLFTSPSSRDFSLIVMRGDPARVLRAAGRGGPHTVYGLCHELGHVLIGWRDSRHQWAHYLGSMLLEDVHDVLGTGAWPDPYDYRRIEGMPRFLRQIKGVAPDRGTDRGTARIFYEVGCRFAAQSWGPALRWIRENRSEQVFHAVERYRLNDLRDALLALGHPAPSVAELFDTGSSKSSVK